MLMDWGLAYDGLNQPDKALEKFRQAAAMLALDTADKIDANFPALWMYRGQIMLATNQPAQAIPMFQRALELDSSQTPARQGLQQAQRMLAGR